MSTNSSISLGHFNGMSQFTTVYWNGTLYICYCDYTVAYSTRTVYLCKVNADLAVVGIDSFDLPQGYVVVTGADYLTASDAMPVVHQSGSYDPGKLYIFVRAVRQSDGANVLFYYSVTDRQLKLLGDQDAPVHFNEAVAQYAVAGFSYGVMVACADNLNRKLLLNFVPWDSLNQSTNITTLQYDFPANLYKFDNLSVAFVPTSGTAASDEAGLNLVCMGSVFYDINPSSNHEVDLFAWETPITIVNGLPAVGNDIQVNFTILPWQPEFRLFYFNSLVLHKTPDGRLCAGVAATYEGNNTLFRLWFRQTMGDWLDGGAPLPNRQAGAGYYFSIGYLLGKVLEQPSVVNPELTDALQPVKRIFFLSRPGTPNLDYQVDDYGYMRRNALARVTPNKKLLLGIIEGPPPIPHENMNLDKKYDPRPAFSADIGSTAITIESKEDYALDINGSLEFLYKDKGETEGYKTTTEMSFGGGGGLVREESTTSKTVYKINLAFQNAEINGKTQLMPQPNGMAFFYGGDCTGYTYDFVDAGGNTPAGALSFLQVFFIEPHVTALPYVMNPYRNPKPGFLLSYVLDADERAALNRHSVIEFKADKGTQAFISTAWAAGGGKAGQSFESYAGHEDSVKVVTNAKKMFGPSVNFDCLGKAEAQAGLKVSAEISWKQGSGKSIGLATDISTLGNVAAPNSYTNFVYDTYHLKENVTWANDLQESLFQKDPQGNILWPVDKNELAVNQLVADTIGDGSAPWKIVYTLAGYHFNQLLQSLPLHAESLAKGITATGTQVATIETAPAKELFDSLNDAGIQTTACVDLLLKAIKDPASKEANEALAQLPAGADKNRLSALVKRLAASPSEQSLLQQIITESQERVLAEWREKNPQTVPRFSQ
ncbi:MAG: hypothetical protein AB1489_13545 [Acidobacteriota bacterium]